MGLIGPGVRLPLTPLAEEYRARCSGLPVRPACWGEARAQGKVNHEVSLKMRSLRVAVLCLVQPSVCC